MTADILISGDEPERPGAARPLAWLLTAGGGLAEAVRAERSRWALWLPIGLGLGIALYFLLPREPPDWSGAAAIAVALAGAVAGRGAGRAAAVCALVCAIGFTAAQLRTWAVATPVLDRETRPMMVEGRVVGIDRLEGEGLRLVLADVAFPAAREGGPVPLRVRVRLHPSDTAPPPGARVALRAILRPPPDPAEPGAYDFRRHAYFLRIGAVGFALAPGTVVAPPPKDGWAAVAAGLERLREDIRARVAARLDGAEGAVTTALLNGEPSAIPQDDLEALRISGLQHLLSISGLHIGLVAGLVFFGLRALLAGVEPLALGWPIKKWAAVAAVLAAGAYTLLVGAPVPTQRAMLMTGLMMLAVLVDRSPFSMRVIAFAATVVLLTQPDALMGPSFQMSFAAVLALIATYEAAGGWFGRRHAEAGPLGRAWLYVLGLALTSLVAGGATTPFALYHFQNVANYGVLANLIAVPITSFLVMPAGMLALVLMPFGLEGWALDAMGAGVQGVLWTAHWVAGLPGSAFLVRAVPWEAMALLSLGGIWLMLWRRPWRLAGLLPCVAAIALALANGRPDVLVTSSGTLVGFRMADGEMLVSSGRAASFEAEAWRRRDGLEGAPRAWGAGGDGTDTLRCDRIGCLWRRDGVTVAHVRSVEALAEDCAVADVVIAPELRVAACGAATVIDRTALERRGAHALRVQEGRIGVETARADRRARPWN